MNKDSLRPVNEIANYIINLKLPHPIRVGIDGITASGKSTFAKNLASELSKQNSNVLATTLDGFHNPKSKRYERGRDSAEGYYFDAYNYQSILENLLIPLGPYGDCHYRTETFDLINDRPSNNFHVKAPINSIVIVDGSFSLRKELRDYWDVSIYLNVNYSIAEDRAANRDAKLFSSAEIARNVTKLRYHGAHRIHTEIANPMNFATFVISNNIPHLSEIIIRNF